MHSAFPEFAANPARWIEKTATDYMKSPANDLGMLSGPEPAFGLPLVGYAAGDDPLWNTFKEVVGEYAWTPVEAFELFYKELHVRPEELTVVAWIVPQTEQTRKDHRERLKEPAETRMPSERWARNRALAEARVNQGLRRYLVECLRMMGVQSLVPMQLPEWSRQPSEKYTFSSNWSERHAAFAAGLGTFGLCDGLITPLGKAVRVGTIIVRHKIPATPRPYTHHQEYCLYHSSGTCKKCIERCPVGALSPEGHNKLVCRAYVHEKVPPYILEQWHIKGHACGFCQVGVPCESRIPGKAARKDA